MQPVALVPRDVDVPAAELALVSSAIQIQLLRDLGPSWGLQATCTAYPSLDDVPPGYVVVFVVADAKGQAGLHFRPEHPNEPPFALVTYRSDGAWSVAASHEVIEILVDPAGQRLIEGINPLEPSQRVSFLVEACDPCQDVSFGYQVDDNHPVLVSDFCLPSFYGQGTQLSPYTFGRNILSPLTVARGGYLSWRNSTAQWYQVRSLGGPSQVIGPLNEEDILESSEHANFRGALDRSKAGYLGPLPPSAQYKKAVRRHTEVSRTSLRTRTSRNKILEKYLQTLLR